MNTSDRIELIEAIAAALPNHRVTESRAIDCGFNSIAVDGDSLLFGSPLHKTGKHRRCNVVLDDQRRVDVPATVKKVVSVARKREDQREDQGESLKRRKLAFLAKSNWVKSVRSAFGGNPDERLPESNQPSKIDLDAVVKLDRFGTISIGGSWGDTAQQWALPSDVKERAEFLRRLDDFLSDNLPN